jgi:hypothetical protein
MDGEHCSDQKTGNGKAIADLLHGRAGRAKRRRGNIRATEVVNYTADGNVDSSHGALTDSQGSRIVTRLAHLGYDGKERRCSGVGEDEGGNSRDGFSERGICHDLIVRYPGSFLRCRSRTTLNTYGDGDNENYSKYQLGPYRDHPRKKE